MQNSDDNIHTPREPVALTDGPFAGWMTWRSDTYENLIGPFCFKIDSDGQMVSAFQPDKRHLNSKGIIHGGCLLSFADFSLFSIAHATLKDHPPSVTLMMNSEFISAGNTESWVYCRGELLRETRSLAFIRGLLTQDDRILLSFSGMIKKQRGVAIPKGA